MHFLYRKWVFLLSLMLFAASLSACGVKGPPEPPYPTEASVQKIAPTPFVTPAEDKTKEDVPFSSEPIEKKKSTTKKKKSSQ